jgi:hypothetical protein
MTLLRQISRKTWIRSPLLPCILLLLPRRVASFSSLSLPSSSSLLSSSLQSSSSSLYVDEVTKWLDDQGVPYRQVELRTQNCNLIPPSAEGTSKCKSLIVELESRQDDTRPRPLLHLIPTPSIIISDHHQTNETTTPVLPPPMMSLNKRLTDLVHSSDATNTTITNGEYGSCFVNYVNDEESSDDVATSAAAVTPNHKIIHLHQDVWTQKKDIVKCRLLAQLGQSKRIFARKTVSRRINATYAMEFLDHHHLWGATRAKYYYGLFVVPKPNKKDSDKDTTAAADEEEELVAVATFSTRRKIVRDGVPHRSHELLRFCAKRDSNVVGGISKLIKIFVREVQPDDIVTVVDRDWGGGSGWHGIGFETVQVHAPMVMAVHPNEPGMRRHLIGAGIGSDARPGLPSLVQDELESIRDAQEALQCLERHGYFPVSDAGVERLLKLIVKNSTTTTTTGREEEKNDHDPVSRTQHLWRHSQPKYAPSYYSPSSGISALLRYAEQDAQPTEEELEASWRATSGTAASARLVFQAPSSLDPKATVEVRERANGWRTVGIVGGITKSIYYSVYKVDPATGRVDPRAVISETYKSMVTLALSAIQKRNNNNNMPSGTSSSGSTTTTLRFLTFGFGAGTLTRFVEAHVPESHHVAIELDSGVAEAVRALFPESDTTATTTATTIQLEVGDALTYSRAPKQEEPFDCILIDVFDEKNLTPPDFYSRTFLQKVRDELLCSTGIVVSNFHSGGQKRTAALEEAAAANDHVFESCCWVDSLDSHPNAGNRILLASTFDIANEEQGEDLADGLTTLAVQAKERWGLNFDTRTRVIGARRTPSKPIL